LAITSDQAPSVAKVVPAQHRDAFELRRHHLQAAFALQHVDRPEGVADVAGQHLLARREALAAEAEIDIGLVGEKASIRASRLPVRIPSR
jgi:hypothetical protein